MKVILLMFGGRAEHPCHRVELGKDMHIAKGVASIQVLLDSASSPVLEPYR